MTNKWSKYAKKYNAEWEKEPQFSGKLSLGLTSNFVEELLEALLVLFKNNWSIANLLYAFLHV